MRPILHERESITIAQAVTHLLGLRFPPKLILNNSGKMIGIDEGDFTLNEFLAMANYQDYEKANRYLLKVKEAITKGLLTPIEDDKITMYSFLTWTARENLLKPFHSYTLRDVCELFVELAGTPDIEASIITLAQDYTKPPGLGTRKKKDGVHNGQSEESIRKRIINAKKYLNGGINKIPGLSSFFTTLAFLIDFHSTTEPSEIVAIALKIKNSSMREDQKKHCINQWLEGHKVSG